MENSKFSVLHFNQSGFCTEDGTGCLFRIVRKTERGCKFEEAGDLLEALVVWLKTELMSTYQVSSLPSQEAKSLLKSSKSTGIVLLRSALIPGALKTRT